jgi:hypothetical protein
VQVLLLVLLGIVLVAGIAAFVLRNLVLAIAVAGALALVPLQFSSTHHRAEAVIDVGTPAGASAERAHRETHVEVTNLDADYLTRLATAAVSGRPQRVTVRADADTNESGRDAIDGATDQIRAAVAAHLPTPAEAEAQATVAENALAVAQGRVDTAKANLAQWRSLRGTASPTRLRMQA